MVTIPGLTPAGSAVAIAVGLAVWAGLGVPGLALLLLFFVTSVALTSLGRDRGAASDRDETGRSAAQVLANGGVAGLASLLALAPGFPGSALVAVGAIAAATADTWATEIGVRFGRWPRSVRTLQPAAPGEPGAVSVEGTLAGVSGAFVVGAAAAALLAGPVGLGWLLVGLAGGIVGMCCDTLAGAFLEPRLARVNTHVVNLIGTLAGGAAGWLVTWFPGAVGTA